MTAKPRVLCVDDEQMVLDSLAASLRKSFDVVTALGGERGLAILAEDRSIVVVTSDMRMPGMSGAVFLDRAAQVAPDVVRMLLTGQSDFDAAITAVNQSGIFRFLAKPCPRDQMVRALEAAVAQHRLATAERVLLEHTVRGTVRMMFDVLALASPAVFGRARRIEQRALEVAADLQLGKRWQLEVAALASQLGAIALPPEVVAKQAAGQPLAADERELVARVPALGARWLEAIPRLEEVCELLAPPPHAADATKLGAQVLAIAIALEADGATWQDVLAHHASDDPRVLQAFAARSAVQRPTHVVACTALQPGMVVAEDVHLPGGALLVPRGYEVTPAFVARLANLPDGAGIAEVKIVAERSIHAS